jgi:hypothetical protein
VANTFTLGNTFSGTADSNSAVTGNIINGGGMGMAGSLYAVKTINGGALTFQFTNAGIGNAYTQITAAQANGAKFLSIFYINDTFSGAARYQPGSGVIEVGGGANGLAIALSSGGPLKVYDSGGVAQVTLSNAGVLTLANTTDSTSTTTGSVITAGGGSHGVTKSWFGGGFKSTSATLGIGYATGAGGAVTQITSRVTGVTTNTICGAITLVSAAGLATYQTFTVTNSAVAATDVVGVSQKSGTDKYIIYVTATTAGTFDITFATTGGVTVEQPVFNFAIIKAVAA